MKVGSSSFKVSIDTVLGAMASMAWFDIIILTILRANASHSVFLITIICLSIIASLISFLKIYCGSLKDKLQKNGIGGKDNGAAEEATANSNPKPENEFPGLPGVFVYVLGVKLIILASFIFADIIIRIFYWNYLSPEKRCLCSIVMAPAISCIMLNHATILEFLKVKPYMTTILMTLTVGIILSSMTTYLTNMRYFLGESVVSSYGMNLFPYLFHSILLILFWIFCQVIGPTEYWTKRVMNFEKKENKLNWNVFIAFHVLVTFYRYFFSNLFSALLIGIYADPAFKLKLSQFSTMFSGFRMYFWLSINRIVRPVLDTQVNTILGDICMLVSLLFYFIFTFVLWVSNTVVSLRPLLKKKQEIIDFRGVYVASFLITAIAYYNWPLRNLLAYLLFWAFLFPIVNFVKKCRIKKSKAKNCKPGALNTHLIALICYILLFLSISTLLFLFSYAISANPNHVGTSECNPGYNLTLLKNRTSYKYS